MTNEIYKTLNNERLILIGRSKRKWYSIPEGIYSADIDKRAGMVWIKNTTDEIIARIDKCVFDIPKIKIPKRGRVLIDVTTAKIYMKI